MRRSKGLRFIVLTLGLLILPSPSPFCAQEIVVPVETQFEFMQKILSYNRNLKNRVGDEIIVGIVYQSLFRASLNAKEALIQAASSSSEKDIDGIPFRCVVLDLENDKPLAERLTAADVNVLYIAPLRAFDIGALAAICRLKKIITFGSIPEYCLSDIAVSLDLKAGRPEILINLEAAKSQGCEFSSKLLNLATVIGPGSKGKSQ